MPGWTREAVGLLKRKCHEVCQCATPAPRSQKAACQCMKRGFVSLSRRRSACSTFSFPHLVWLSGSFGVQCNQMKTMPGSLGLYRLTLLQVGQLGRWVTQDGTRTCVSLNFIGMPAIVPEVLKDDQRIACCAPMSQQQTAALLPYSMYASYWCPSTSDTKPCTCIRFHTSGRKVILG